MARVLFPPYPVTGDVSVVTLAQASNSNVVRPFRRATYIISRRFRLSPTEMLESLFHLHARFEGQFFADGPASLTPELYFEASDTQIDAGLADQITESSRQFARDQLTRDALPGSRPYVQRANRPKWTILASILRVYFPDIVRPMRGHIEELALKRFKRELDMKRWKVR